MASNDLLAVSMIGSGEYTTGFVGSGASPSDKKIGVVGLTLFDLRRRGKVGKLSIVGTSGSKFPSVREHFKKNIEDAYKGMDCSFESFPGDQEKDAEAYKKAIDQLPKGSAITIFTPDSTHFPIALYAIERGIHVLVTKPATQLLSHHQELIAAAEKHGVFVMVEHHKRFDPVYGDAKAKAALLGEFNYFNSYMSQPKTQLETFKAWAGQDSDISYYLNSHHIDIHVWSVGDRAVPVKVTASASRGTAETDCGCVAGTEDTISLLVEWKSTKSEKHFGTAIYTASWTAPVGVGVHSDQRFHYMGAKGEIHVDQAKRGYSVGLDNSGISWINPFYMKYPPNEAGEFDGQRGYGYVSIEKFIDGCIAVNSGKTTPADLDRIGLPTIRNTVLTTAILEAGRKSLDEKRSVSIEKHEETWTLK
ncbi:D-galacturonic acid reductase [Atractiella rhizophila]|nr:D-galacturonic acid reductase [Atractiella rhizophila]